ncbi:hypothetical protein [Massilia sp. METH4]|uniref:hypothetical protein n=1 Tax=Massilia sp. METH4 TaxID=3123041 RepID=UPI0030CA6A6E
MKNRIFLCISVLLSMPGGVTADSLPDPKECKTLGKNLLLKLSAKSDAEGSKSPIHLTVTIKNIGEDNVSLVPYMGLEHYWLRFEVRDASGEKMTWIGPDINLRSTSKRVVLYPGYFWGVTIRNIEDHYNISRPGQYSIRAIYGITWDGSCPMGKHLSNVVTVERRANGKPLTLVKE